MPELRKRGKHQAARDVLIAAGAALAFELLLMLVNRIYPFGPNSFLISDAHNENISYLIYYRSIFLSSNDLFYTFSKSLGGDMVGLFSVYMASPPEPDFSVLSAGRHADCL